MDSKSEQFEYWVPPIWIERNFTCVRIVGTKPQLEHQSSTVPQQDKRPDLPQDSVERQPHAMTHCVQADPTTDLGIVPISGYRILDDR